MGNAPNTKDLLRALAARLLRKVVLVHLCSDSPQLVQLTVHFVVVLNGLPCDVILITLQGF